MSECRVLSGKDCIITCKFGMRTHPVTGAYKLHNGVDVVGEGYSLAYITAHTEGIVEFAGYNSALGYHVNIRLENGDMMQYCHMQGGLQVKTGDFVEQKQILGIMGSTGLSTGAHLHFGIQSGGVWVDPAPYLHADYLEDTMTYERFCEYMAQYEAERNAKPVSDWAKEAWASMVSDGVFDGSRPQAPLTRQEASIIIERRNELTNKLGV